MRILLVEDDPALSRTMAQGLENAGHRIERAHSVEEAQHWWAVQAFDAVLLDLNLPHTAHARSGLGSGLTALRSARARGDRTPVLVLSARDSTEDRIVKNFLRERSGGDAAGSRHRPAPVTAARAPTFQPPARKVRPGKAEEARNPRARSATLRSAVRTAAPAWPDDTQIKEAISC